MRSVIDSSDPFHSIVRARARTRAVTATRVTAVVSARVTTTVVSAIVATAIIPTATIAVPTIVGLRPGGNDDGLGSHHDRLLNDNRRIITTAVIGGLIHAD